jgi:hypothetical protein
MFQHGTGVKVRRTGGQEMVQLMDMVNEKGITG